MIVKVQLSLATTASGPQVLIYDKDRKIQREGPADTETLRKMRGRPKAFFLAAMEPDGSLELGIEVPDPGW